MRIQNKLNSTEINMDFNMLKWTYDTVLNFYKRSFQLIIGIGLSFLLTDCTTKNTQADQKSDQGVFELMDSSKTGVLFRNDIVEYDSFNYFYYDEFYEGAGTGIIDVNNDGLRCEAVLGASGFQGAHWILLRSKGRMPALYREGSDG